MRRGIRIGLATGGAAAVIGTGAAIAVPVFASGGTSTGTAAGTTTSGTTTTSTRDPQADRLEYEKALAKELGVDVSKLQAAEKAARESVFLANLDDMVAAGRLTQEQADALKKAAAAGTLDETLKSQARARLKASLDGQVKAGLLTQAQADAMLKRFDDNQDAGVPGLGFGGGHHGGRGGHEQGRGFGGYGTP